MLEKIIKFGPNPSLVGVLTEAEPRLQKNFCVIISNSGLIHKPGPNRLSVKIARQLAAAGVHAFRFDFSGMGDSPLSTAVQDSLRGNISEIGWAMDKITETTGIDRFALYGLCSAAEVSFHAGLEDDRVKGLILVDGYYQTRELLERILPAAARKCNLRYYKKALLDYRRWIKILSGRSKAVSVKNLVAIPLLLARPLSNKLKTLVKVRRPVEVHHRPIDTGIDKWKILLGKGTAVQLIYSEGSHYVDLYHHSLASWLKPFRKSRTLDYQLVKNADHTFTPVWAQQRLADMVCNWAEQKSQS